MEIPKNEKEIIKEKALFLIEKGYTLEEDEFLKYKSSSNTIQIAYSFQEAGVGIFFQDPFSFFSIGWLYFYIAPQEYNKIMENKPEKKQIILLELEFLRRNFDKLTEYNFCKGIQEKNQSDISNIDPDSFDL